MWKRNVWVFAKGFQPNITPCELTIRLLVWLVGCTVLKYLVVDLYRSVSEAVAVTLTGLVAVVVAAVDNRVLRLYMGVQVTREISLECCTSISTIYILQINIYYIYINCIHLILGKLWRDSLEIVLSFLWLVLIVFSRLGSRWVLFFSRVFPWTISTICIHVHTPFSWKQ